MSSLHELMKGVHEVFVTQWFSETPTLDGFGWALGGAAMMSFLGTLGEWVIRGIGTLEPRAPWCAAEPSVHCAYEPSGEGPR